MTRSQLRIATVAFAAVLLLIGPTVFADGNHAEQGKTMSLVGQLSGDEDSGYQLVEQESGQTIQLEATSSTDLESYVGQTVRVSGQWEQGADGTKVFQVSQVEKTSSSDEGPSEPYQQ